jgi:hypothetical protein
MSDQIVMWAVALEGWEEEDGYYHFCRSEAELRECVRSYLEAGRRWGQDSGKILKTFVCYEEYEIHDGWCYYTIPEEETYEERIKRERREARAARKRR